MLEVARYWSVCNETYNQNAVETLIHYVAWSEYPEEIIRDRNVRSRACIDGFGPALICFNNAGLFAGQPVRDFRDATPVKQSTPSTVQETQEFRWNGRDDKHLKLRIQFETRYIVRSKCFCWFTCFYLNDDCCCWCFTVSKSAFMN